MQPLKLLVLEIDVSAAIGNVRHESSEDETVEPPSPKRQRRQSNIIKVTIPCMKLTKKALEENNQFRMVRPEIPTMLYRGTRPTMGLAVCKPEISAHEQEAILSMRSAKKEETKARETAKKNRIHLLS